MAEFLGTGGDDLLTGTSDDDLLEGNAGNDTLVGGDGVDTARMLSARGDYLITLDPATRTYSVYDFYYRDGLDSLDSIEFLQFIDTKVGLIVADAPGILEGSQWPDYITGSDGADTLLGAEGNDLLYGGLGADSITGGSGSDYAHGGDGDDTFVGGDGSNSFDAGAGNDVMVFDGAFSEYSVAYINVFGSYLITRPSHDGISSASLANEWFLFADGAREINGMLVDVGITKYAQVPGLTQGTAKNDYLCGTVGDETLEGGAGNDWITGTGGGAEDGNDLMLGEAGADVLMGGRGNDTLIGGAGDDTLTGYWIGMRTGASDADTAVFSGNRDNYLSSYDTATGTFTVTDTVSDDGTDKVSDIDYFAFADGTATAAEMLLPVHRLIEGGAGNDSLVAGAWSDTIQGAAGNDTLAGQGGDDSLQGDAGADVLRGGAGNDLLDGGADVDTATFDEVQGAVQVDLELGMATGDGGDDVLTDIENVIGSAGADEITGNGSMNILRGGAGDDDIAAGAGDDILEGGSGNDTLTGGSGSDRAVYDSVAAIQVDLAVGQVHGAATGDDVLSEIENVTAGQGADALQGDGADNALEGAAGNDTLAGGGGNDTLLGGDGTDTVVFAGTFADYAITYDGGAAMYVVSDSVGGRDGSDRVSAEQYQFSDGVRLASQLVPVMGTASDDVVRGTGGPEYLQGLAGNDMLLANPGDDTLDGGAGNDSLDGGTGTDTATYATASGAVSVSLNIIKFQPTGGAGSDLLAFVENLVGSGWGDTLTGNAMPNLLDGGNGNDILIGGIGIDTLVGGLGDDRFVVESAADIIVEAAGQGIDTLEIPTAVVLAGNVENLVLSGSAAVNGTGNEQPNQLTGNKAANSLWGLAGNDTLNGGTGADGLFGGSGDDTYLIDALDQVVENADEGIDTVVASVSYTLGAAVEQLVLSGKAAVGTGNALDNTITGSIGANQLLGGAGNDILDGKQGNDVLAGGAGNDRFAFSTPIAKNIDKIADFNAAEDGIVLSRAVFTALPEGVLDGAAFQSGANSVAAAAAVRIIFNTGTGALLYDADGAGVAKAVQFATVVLTGLQGPLTAADFTAI